MELHQPSAPQLQIRLISYEARLGTCARCDTVSETKIVVHGHPAWRPQLRVRT